MISSRFGITSMLDARDYFGAPAVNDASNNAYVVCHMGEPASVTLSFRPQPECNEQDDRIFIRYIAAEINNRMMTTGSKLKRLVASEKVARAVNLELESRYGQVSHLSKLLYKPSRSNSETDNVCTGTAWSKIPPVRADGAAIGVNVGQSFIKGYAANSITEREIHLQYPLLAGQGTKGQRIGRNTESMFRALIHHETRAAVLGLTVGGMVQAGNIIQESGITSGLSGADLPLVVNLPTKIMRSLGRAVFIEQDARAKAYYHSALGKRKCLIIDVGTSLGGSYIDASGCIPEYLNQIGRVAWDLTDFAQDRQDGRGKGLLSQCLSANGLASVATDEHIKASQLHELDAALERGVPSAQALAQGFCHLFTEVMTLLRSYYDVAEVVVTGGTVRGRLGDMILDMAQRSQGTQVVVTRSLEPVFDSALGVAWASAASFPRVG